MTSKKRAVSEDSEVEEQDVEATLSHKAKRSKVETTADNSTSEKPSRPPFNALPISLAPVRPCRRLFVFGNGDCGQLGMGVSVMGDILKPKLHNWFEEAVKEQKFGGPECGLEVVVAGGLHTLAIDEAGTVWSWGVNDNGALGRYTENVLDPKDSKGNTKIDSESLESQPMPVETLTEESFRAVFVAAGASVSVAISSEGRLRVWGSFRTSDGSLGFDGSPNSPKIRHLPLTLPTLAKQQFVSAACGADHILALTTQGHIWVWGNGQMGELGRKIIERRKVNGLAPERLALRRIRLIACGRNHSFAVDHKGVVFGWGANAFGQTGIAVENEVVDDRLQPTEDIIWEPTEVKALHPKALGLGRRVVQISGGEHHSLFLISDGSVYACGRCDGSELGLEDDHPAMLEKRVKEAAMTQTRKERLEKERMKEEKKRRKSNKPDAAESTSFNVDSLTPITIPYISKPCIMTFPCGDTVTAISAGERHNLAVSSNGNGEVFAWGFGNQCQLGLGKDESGTRIESASTPQRVISEEMKAWRVDGVSAGGHHCVLLARPQ